MQKAFPPCAERPSKAKRPGQARPFIPVSISASTSVVKHETGLAFRWLRSSPPPVPSSSASKVKIRLRHSPFLINGAIFIDRWHSIVLPLDPEMGMAPRDYKGAIRI
jgi:hypothetical protein